MCSGERALIPGSVIEARPGIAVLGSVLWPGPVLSSIAAWYCVRRHKKSDTDLVDRRPGLALVRKTYDPGNFLANKITVTKNAMCWYLLLESQYVLTEKYENKESAI